MTQFQHTLKALLEGRKTETSRIALPEPDGTGEYDCEMITYPKGQIAVSRLKANAQKWTHKWVVGQDYAIQPGRGQCSVGRYRVEAVWKQDVRTLTTEQIKAEGFSTLLEFLEVWNKMHDPSRQFSFDGEFYHYYRGIDYGWQIATFSSLIDMLNDRPAKHYMAWRLKITVLFDTVDWNAPAVAALQLHSSPVY